MGIVSRLQGGLDSCQSHFIPETFAKAIPSAIYRLYFHHVLHSGIEH